MSWRQMNCNALSWPLVGWPAATALAWRKCRFQLVQIIEARKSLVLLLSFCARSPAQEGPDGRRPVRGAGAGVFGRGGGGGGLGAGPTHRRHRWPSVVVLAAGSCAATLNSIVGLISAVWAWRRAPGARQQEM